MEHRSVVRVARRVHHDGNRTAGVGDRDAGRAHPDFADAPLYVVTDAARRRLVAIPCWEIFRVYYAGAPRVARLLFDFPRWKAGTLERMLRSFDGHQFFGPAKPASHTAAVYRHPARL
jgi:hypothetical protein